MNRRRFLTLMAGLIPVALLGANKAVSCEPEPLKGGFTGVGPGYKIRHDEGYVDIGLKSWTEKDHAELNKMIRSTVIDSLKEQQRSGEVLRRVQTAVIDMPIGDPVGQNRLYY